jgi:hypothetical protein
VLPLVLPPLLSLLLIFLPLVLLLPVLNFKPLCTSPRKIKI